jgi:hypothetical protein
MDRSMESCVAQIDHAFRDLPQRPPMTLRAANALDDYEAPPDFDPVVDSVAPEYLEAHFWGISYLDPQSWLFYLPHLLKRALACIDDGGSNLVNAFLISLRPPDRDPPRFGSLNAEQEQAVSAVLDELAFSPESQWQREALCALEEWWAPGATYR